MSNTMGNKYDSSNAETLSGAKSLAVTDAKYQFLDPGGSARNVDLPDMRTLTTDINSEAVAKASPSQQVKEWEQQANDPLPIPVSLHNGMANNEAVQAILGDM